MSHGWGYGKDNGPHTWCIDFPLAAGRQQSPINIYPKTATFDATLNQDPLVINYTPESKMEVFNNGHSLQAAINEDSVISRGPLKNKYRLKQFHFHWGGEDGRGSEHLLDGRSYAAELHLVHWNCELFDSFNDAVVDPNGLAVLGIFIKVGDEHKGFRTISDEMSKLTYKHSKLNVVSFDPTCLLPSNTSRYYTYAGSLTTPPCCESVRWIVLEESIDMSPRQLKLFRSMMSDANPVNNNDAIPIIDNFRPVMPVCERQVSSSFRYKKGPEP